jgi:hypothetical protein
VPKLDPSRIKRNSLKSHIKMLRWWGPIGKMETPLAFLLLRQSARRDFVGRRRRDDSDCSRVGDEVQCGRAGRPDQFLAGRTAFPITERGRSRSRAVAARRRAMVRGDRGPAPGVRSGVASDIAVCFADEPFVSRTNKQTRRLADQLRSPLRAAPVFGASLSPAITLRPSASSSSR